MSVKETTVMVDVRPCGENVELYLRTAEGIALYIPLDLAEAEKVRDKLDAIIRYLKA